MNKTIFKKEYDYESTYDLGRDIAEAFDPDYNSNIEDIPKDEYDYLQGKFTVTILWEPE